MSVIERLLRLVLNGEVYVHPVELSKEPERIEAERKLRFLEEQQNLWKYGRPNPNS